MQNGNSLVDDYGAANGLQGKMADFRLYWGVLEPADLESWIQPK